MVGCTGTRDAAWQRPGADLERNVGDRVTGKVRVRVNEAASGRPDLADATRALRRLLEVVRAREVCAPPVVIARLEGAIIALEAVATGKTPVADDILVPGPYSV
jgi:hypothetical protein